MLAWASFDYARAANTAASHARLIRALGRLPPGPLHRASLAVAWLETWLRWPLKTLKLLDSVDETLSLLDPDGGRFGLTREVRARFRRYQLYHYVCDLFLLLACLERPRFRRRALVLENEEALLREKERGPGAIVAGFRIGAHPALPWVLGSLGFPVSMIVVDEALAEMGRGLAERFVPASSDRIRFLNARDPLVLARCLGELKAGGLVSTLVELSPLEYEKTTEVRFLDWNMPVPYGIAYLAAATGRSIVPAVLAREAGPRFRLRFGEPLPPPARDRTAIGHSTQQLYRALEREVLARPEQWAGWMLLPRKLGIELRTPASAEAAALS